MPIDIEERLRETGAPQEPPAHFEDVARRAALGGRPVVVDMRTARPRGRGGRVLVAAAVLVASAAAALVIGVGGRSDPTVIRTISMQGANPSIGASISFLENEGPVRPVVVKIWGLQPAPEGSYYQVWMNPGGGVPTTALVAVNTKADGTVEARTTMPAGIGWKRCWVTLENGSTKRSVMTS